LLPFSPLRAQETEEDDEHWEDEPEEDDEEKEDDVDDLEQSVFFKVRVSKAGAAEELLFDCVTDGAEVDILRVDLGRPGAESSDGSYTGPEFDELDETLQTAFAEFLEQRDIGPAFAEYLLEVSYDKEQREYCNWLHRVGAFVKA